MSFSDLLLVAFCIWAVATPLVCWMRRDQLIQLGFVLIPILMAVDLFFFTAWLAGKIEWWLSFPGQMACFWLRFCVYQWPRSQTSEARSTP
jgi:hypothetical protein